MQSCRLSPVAVLVAACMPVAGIHFVGAPPRPSISFLLLVAPTGFCAGFVPTVLRRDDRLDDHIRRRQLRHDSRNDGPRIPTPALPRGGPSRPISPNDFFRRCRRAYNRHHPHATLQSNNELIPMLKFPPSRLKILLRSRPRRTIGLGRSLSTAAAPISPVC